MEENKTPPISKRRSTLSDMVGEAMKNFSPPEFSFTPIDVIKAAKTRDLVFINSTFSRFYYGLPRKFQTDYPVSAGDNDICAPLLEKVLSDLSLSKKDKSNGFFILGVWLIYQDFDDAAKNKGAGFILSAFDLGFSVSDEILGFAYFIRGNTLIKNRDKTIQKKGGEDMLEAAKLRWPSAYLALADLYETGNVLIGGFDVITKWLKLALTVETEDRVDDIQTRLKKISKDNATDYSAGVKMAVKWSEQKPSVKTASRTS
jgi:hypothetical protein